MGHTIREQLGRPRLASDKDKLSNPGSIGSDKIQVCISDCNRLIRPNIKLLQGGEKGLRIGFECTIIATQYNIKGKRIARKDAFNAATGVVGDQCTLDMRIVQAAQQFLRPGNKLSVLHTLGFVAFQYPYAAGALLQWQVHELRVDRAPVNRKIDLTAHGQPIDRGIPNRSIHIE